MLMGHLVRRSFVLRLARSIWRQSPHLFAGLLALAIMPKLSAQQTSFATAVPLHSVLTAPLQLHNPFREVLVDAGYSSSRAPRSTLAEPLPAPPPADTESDSGNSCGGEDWKLYRDCRGVFDASFYVGLAIDTFAGSETLTYLNPGATGRIQERAIGGFDFAYRVFGDKTPKVEDPFHPSLWIYGETTHGVRSVDINCSNNPDLPVCKANLGQVPNPGDQLYYILRNATSLEGYMGLRYEFYGLNRDSDTPASLYIKGQAGFLTVAGGPGSALDMHQIALGAVATKGKFQDSYLEVGWGRSDTFATARRKRIKIDGYLQWEIPRLTGLSGFAQILVDTDLGRGSDAIQSYIGLNYDLDQLLHKQ